MSLLEDVPKDCEAARLALRQAKAGIESSKIDGVDGESRYAMRYDAARKTCDALLRAEGKRIKDGKGSHREYIKHARVLLGPDHAALLAQIETARVVRNDVQYRTREVSELELAGLLAAAQELHAVVAEHVDGICPPAP